MDGEQSKIPLGFVQKSHGLKGELLISLNSANIEFEKRIRTVWLGDDPDHLHPWNIEYLRLQGSNAFLKLKDVNSREEADYLKGVTVFISADDIIDDTPVRFIGYTVYTESENRYIGKVADVDLNEIQQRLIVKTDRAEIIIPFVDEFIKNIDDEKKLVRVNLIDGLEM
ncbi:MAG: 16S rRNA processing protein RimM [Candidatus Marinimicrobia bacterium]|nr:16S rRNA processing protein RimM [Candidatus Neomarinimicrobiota bacterium]